MSCRNHSLKTGWAIVSEKTILPMDLELFFTLEISTLSMSCGGNVLISKQNIKVHIQPEFSGYLKWE